MVGSQVLQVEMYGYRVRKHHPEVPTLVREVPEMMIISDGVNGRKLRRDGVIARNFGRDGVIGTPPEGASLNEMWENIL